MKKLILVMLLLIVLSGCSPQSMIPSDLQTFIQKQYQNQISLIKSKEEVPVKFVDQKTTDAVMGWCVAYEVVNESEELWKYESLYTKIDGKWVDVGSYNNGVAVFPPGYIMDHRWCDYKN